MTTTPPSGEQGTSTPPGGTPPAPRRGPTPRLVAALVLALVAVSGVLCGVALDRLVLSPHWRGRAWAFGPRGARSPEELRREARTRFARELQLTPDQSARIDTIMAHQLVRMRAIRDSVRPSLDSVIVDTRRQIEAVLTPEQRQRFRTFPFQPRGRGLRRGGPMRPPGGPPDGGPGPAP